MPQETLNLINSAFKICVDAAGPASVDGRVFGLRLVTPLPFQGLTQLLLCLERLMDRQNFPQAYQRIRTFHPGAAPVYGDPCLPEGAMDQQTVDAAAGGVATFLLRVLSRQSATWQGEVDWLDGSPVQSFPSDLALLGLLESKLFP